MKNTFNLISSREESIDLILYGIIQRDSLVEKLR